VGREMDVRNLVIRPAQPADQSKLWPLVCQFATSFEPERAAFARSFSALLDRDDTAVLVAEIEEAIVGYLLASFHGTMFANGPVAWVEEIMVAEVARRSGIGRALMGEAERWATRIPTTYIGLATRRASEFYEALGYEQSASFFNKLFTDRDA